MPILMWSIECCIIISLVSIYIMSNKLEDTTPMTHRQRTRKKIKILLLFISWNSFHFFSREKWSTGYERAHTNVHAKYTTAKCWIDMVKTVFLLVCFFPTGLNNLFGCLLYVRKQCVKFIPWPIIDIDHLIDVYCLHIVGATELPLLNAPIDYDLASEKFRIKRVTG